MKKQLINQVTRWLKHDLMQILIVGALFITSLTFMYYFISETIIILMGAHHVFAFTIWSIMLIAALYLLPLLITQLWEHKQTKLYEKIKPTLTYITLIVIVSYFTIANGHFAILAAIYILSFIGALTGHLLEKNERK